MPVFSANKADRVLFFILSSGILLVIGPAAIGIPLIYPTETLLLRALKSVTGTALLLLVQFAALVWIWTVFRAEWTKRWFNDMRRKMALTMIALPVLVAMWFLTGMK